MRHLIRRLCCRYFWIGSDWFGLGRWCSVGLEALFKTQKVRLTLEASVVFHVQSRWTPVVRHSSGLFVFTLVGETVRIDESIIKSECPTFVEKKEKFLRLAPVGEKMAARSGRRRKNRNISAFVGGEQAVWEHKKRKEPEAVNWRVYRCSSERQYWNEKRRERGRRSRVFPDAITVH